VASRLHTIERSQVVRRPLDDVFAFFADAANLEVITPPFLRFRIVTPTPVAMRRGAQIDYRLSLHGAPVRWRTLITRWEPGQSFVDLQLTGPFALWEHTHTFAEGAAGTTIRDRVRYRMPFGPIGTIAHRTLVARDLHKVFDYRRNAVAHLLG
jgi:ligand-binding SRPBCC domain-containing protein